MKNLLIISLLLLGGCHYLQKPNDTPPSGDYVFKSSGLIRGIATTNNDSIHDVSFTDNTSFQVSVNGVFLNKYEYSVSKNVFTFGKEVIDFGGGSISFKSPPAPVAPKGSEYIIQFTN